MKATPESSSRVLVQLALFRAGAFTCGLDIAHIQEINRSVTLTPVHEAPSCVRGIINLRGNIVTVIDLRRKLGLDPIEVAKYTRNVVVKHDKELVGLLVDSIDDIVEVDSSAFQPIPTHLHRELGEAFDGVVQFEEDLVAILALEHLLSDVGGH